jgi:hypothetical protein
MNSKARTKARASKRLTSTQASSPLNKSIMKVF